MLKPVFPYYASGSKVYHIFRSCTLGNNIERYNLKGGKGGKRMCMNCKKIFTLELKIEAVLINKRDFELSNFNYLMVHHQKQLPRKIYQ